MEVRKKEMEGERKIRKDGRMSSMKSGEGEKKRKGEKMGRKQEGKERGREGKEGGMVGEMEVTRKERECERKGFRWEEKEI